MSDQNPPSDQTVTFFGFVLSLAHTAAVHFGDIPDPVTGEPGEMNLSAASQVIDILALVEDKTKGNLTAEERQLLEQIVFELRMRYVEATKSDQAGKGGDVGSSRSRIILP